MSHCRHMRLLLLGKGHGQATANAALLAVPALLNRARFDRELAYSFPLERLSQ